MTVEIGPCPLVKAERPPRSDGGHRVESNRRRRPWRTWARRGILAALALLRNFAVWVIRTKNPTVLCAIKQLNHRWLNPWMLHYARGRRWCAGRIEHRGRKSGRPYATPLWIEPVDGGFVVLMPYGPEVDWARNLLAAGEAVIQEQGVRQRVGNPRVLPSHDLLAKLPGLARRLVRVHGIDSLMRIDVLPEAAPEGALSP